MFRLACRPGAIVEEQRTDQGRESRGDMDAHSRTPPTNLSPRRAISGLPCIRRMEWDRPSPTITGGCTTFSKGRFGHPKADRTISVREAALLQTFPLDYRLDTPYMDHVCNMIATRSRATSRKHCRAGASIKCREADLIKGIIYQSADGGATSAGRISCGQRRVRSGRQGEQR